MMRGLVLLIVLALARTASAGVCLDESEANDGMKQIEAFAKNKAKGKDVFWLCVELDAIRLKPRIERACRAIADRDGLQGECPLVAAAAGLTRLGDHDLYAFVTEKPDDPLLYGHGLGVTRTQMLRRMGDPRAVSAVVETWKATIPRAAQQEKRRSAMMGWSAWRQHAAEVIGALGGKDEIAFLDEQAKATKDTFVAKACRAAIAAIEKRLAAAPAPATAPAPAPVPAPSPKP